ncbi:MAG TPA: 2-hydroxyacid dehydrogenase [Kineosporiaceae bacterium]
MSSELPGAAPVVTVPDDRWLDLWPDGEAPVDARVWNLTGDPSPGATFVVLPYLDGWDLLPRLADVRALRVVHTLTAGYEHVLPHLPDGVLLCNAAGVHDASTAELAVGLAIAGQRGLGDFARAQPQGRWLAGTRASLADRRVLLLGAGSVGAAIARRLAPFEVELTRVARHARHDALGHVHAVSELPELLPRHEIVILVVPLSASTRGMVDAAFLAAMPDGALLVNVARGPVVVTEDLLAELVSGRLRAALDVTDPEPLPPGHPLWAAPNTLISPHVGGDTTAFPPRARALLRDQLTRFATGAELLNVVAGRQRTRPAVPQTGVERAQTGVGVGPGAVDVRQAAEDHA